MKNLAFHLLKKSGQKTDGQKEKRQEKTRKDKKEKEKKRKKHKTYLLTLVTVCVHLLKLLDTQTQKWTQSLTIS